MRAHVRLRKTLRTTLHLHHLLHGLVVCVTAADIWLLLLLHAHRGDSVCIAARILIVRDLVVALTGAGDAAGRDVVLLVHSVFG